MPVSLIAASFSLASATTPYKRKKALRDIAVAELLFSTGMRISELCNLSPSDVNLNDNIVLIYGKGAKERKMQIGNTNVINILTVLAGIAIETGSQTNAIGPTQIGKSTQQSALVYRVEDIAQMLSISLRAAYTLCNTTTDFRVLHIGTSIRVSKASFDAWLARIEEA